MPSIYMYMYVVTAAILLLNVALGQNVRQATCDVKSGSGVGSVSGTITLSQPIDGGNVSLVIKLVGLTPTGLHGFHVHSNSSLGSQCTEAAGHLNNLNTLHGAPYNPVDSRHTGDLGNIEADANGNVDETISDWLISLTGENSVINKPIVIHQMPDDLGLGDAPDSNTTGNAGARVGCCLITETSSAPSAKLPSVPLVTILLYHGIRKLTENM